MTTCRPRRGTPSADSGAPASRSGSTTSANHCAARVMDHSAHVDYGEEGVHDPQRTRWALNSSPFVVLTAQK
jgi:hypothetical protein